MSKLQVFLDSQHSLSNATRHIYRCAIKKFEQISEKPFEQVYQDKEIIHNVLKQISKTVSPSSWNLYLTKYKRYAKFLFDPEDEVCPHLWIKIKIKKIDWEKKLKHKYLTKKQFYKLLDVIDYPRDKAMYGVCVEGALRAGELLDLKIRDVHKTSYGYDVTVSGKTGSSSFPVVLFAPLLTHWLNFHPFKNDPDSPLWLRRKTRAKQESNEAILIGGCFVALKKYCKRAGLPKISLHWLRHTKITWTAKNKKVRISDEMAKKMFRWSKNSTMYSHYTHLHGTDSKDSFLALAGVKTETEENEDSEVLQPKKCFNCNELNSVTSIHCMKCGFVLDEEEAKRLVAKNRLLEEMMKAYRDRIEYEEHLRELRKKVEEKK